MQNKPLSLRGLLFSRSPKILIAATALGMVSGVLYALVIPTILAALDSSHEFMFGEQNREHIQSIFFALIVLVLITKASSVILVNNLAKDAVAKLRCDLSNKISAMEVPQIEKIGLPKLLNVLTEDMSRVTDAALAIPMVLVSMVSIAGILVYLAILDLQIFIFSILGIFLGLLIFQFPVSRTKVHYNRARSLRDAMQEGFRGLIFGAYELKLNRKKSRRFVKDEIEQPILQSIQNEKRGDVILHIAGNTSEVLCFLAIGLVVFFMPKGTEFEQQSLYGVAMALLYIAGPIASILSFMQQVKIGEISLEKINQIHRISVRQQQDDALINANSRVQINNDWQQLSLTDVEYTYELNGAMHENSFSIGKINLTLSRGLTYFIVGGNGSGKSTLSKVLSFHYLTDYGQIRFDQQVVDRNNLDSARERLFVIYSNYHLFNTIYKDLTDSDLALIKEYLALFALDDKTQLVGNKFTTVKLSDGQRRRLALIVALVEDRDIYVLDEWAADQDPQFKDLFYDKVLPQLKAKGKTIIAITHDDRYFSYCDQVIKMENGQIIDFITPRALPDPQVENLVCSA